MQKNAEIYLRQKTNVFIYLLNVSFQIKCLGAYCFVAICLSACLSVCPQTESRVCTLYAHSFGHVLLHNTKVRLLESLTLSV